jgi:hypothetical protein
MVRQREHGFKPPLIWINSMGIVKRYSVIVASALGIPANGRVEFEGGWLYK